MENIFMGVQFLVMKDLCLCLQVRLDVALTQSLIKSVQ